MGIVRLARTLLATAIMTATLVVAVALPTADAGLQDPPMVFGGGSQPKQQPPRKSFERDDARLLRFHNKARSQHGVSKLTTDAGLTSFARRRANEMAAKEQVWHSRNLPAGRRWYVVGENVGCAETIEEIFDGFMTSRSHRANVVRPGFRAIGIGVAVRGGARYVAVVYGEPWPAAPAEPTVATSPASPGPPALTTAKPLPARPAAGESQSVTVLVRLVALEG